MRNLGDPAGQSGQFEARFEPRAFCSLCAVKEFLIFVTIFLVCVDLFDVYANIIRVTGTTLLPFPGNHTEFYYTRIEELNIYDMVVSSGELFSVVVLSLSVCGESIDGIVCAMCGFATCFVLEFAYMMWLAVAVVWDSVAEHLDAEDVGFTALYSFVPYFGLLVIRGYTLMKAQAFRRSLVRSKQFRQRMNESSTLLAQP